MLDSINGHYTRYGKSTNCPASGRGSDNTNHVYYTTGSPKTIVLSNATTPYISLGCFEENMFNLRLQEGTHPFVNDRIGAREQPISKCYQVALSRGHNFFALLAGGSCYSGVDSTQVVRSNFKGFCPTDGLGSVGVYHVFSIKNASTTPEMIERATQPLNSSLHTSLGCFLESSDPKSRTMKLQEGTHSLLDGHYKNRSSPIAKCYNVAVARGHNMFALQDEGMCLTNLDWIDGGNYSRPGNASNCLRDGLGQKGINHVYRVNTAPVYDPYAISPPWQHVTTVCLRSGREIPGEDIPYLYSPIEKYNTATLRKCYEYVKSRPLPAPWTLRNGTQVIKTGGQNYFAVFRGGIWCNMMSFSTSRWSSLNQTTTVQYDLDTKPHEICGSESALFVYRWS